MPVPNLQSALRGMGKTMQYQHVQKTVVDQTLVETTPPAKWFSATRTPTPDRRLALKPEGQRAWIWWTIYTRTVLALGDAVMDGSGASFRVMSSANWSDAGFYSYDIAQGPSPETEP